MHKASAILGFVLLLAGGTASADNNVGSSATTLTEWTMDTAHARVGFSVPHLVVSEVDGQFKRFSGRVQLDEKDLTRSKLEFSAEVASIDTENADRDKHLIGPDFFDSERHPKISFVSQKIVRSGKGYKITGDLTIRGVTKTVVLDAQLSEPIQNPWGKQVRAAKLTGSINRNDFGVSWNKSLDKGGVVVGDTVQLNVKLELNK